MSSACELARFLERTTSEVLTLERASKIWKVRETSITDMIIASFRAQKAISGVTVDASDESTTGGDFEVIFRIGGFDLACVFQAKRIRENTSGSFSIPELFHPHGTGTQNLDLLNYAKSNRIRPFYALFLPKSALQTHSITATPLAGIVVQTANHVRNRGFRRPKKNVLALEKHLPGVFNFHKLFCDFDAAISIRDFERRVFNAAGDYTSPEVSLAERRTRDTEHRIYARILIEK